MSRPIFIAVCVVLFAAVHVVQGQSASAFRGLSKNVSADTNDTLDLYSVVTRSTQKSYFVGIREKETDANVCYGVLISPTQVLTSGCKQTYNSDPKWSNWFHQTIIKQYAVIGSRYNSGSHDDGSETIKIRDDYNEYDYYSDSGYEAVSIYTLEQASKLTPVTLPDAVTISLAANTAVTTYGWANVNNDYVMTARTLKATSSDTCAKQKISFKDCICTMTSSADDGCNIVNGSPLIMKQGADEILIGLRFTITEACGVSGFPIAFTSFSGVLDWIKAGGVITQDIDNLSNTVEA